MIKLSACNQEALPLGHSRSTKTDLNNRYVFQLNSFVSIAYERFAITKKWNLLKLLDGKADLSKNPSQILPNIPWLTKKAIRIITPYLPDNHFHCLQ